VRLALSLLAYNPGNLWRRLTLPRQIENWSLTSLQRRLANVGKRRDRRTMATFSTVQRGHSS
jgi:hypothetical protein